MAALILLLACGRPPGFEGCGAIRGGEAREECRFVEAKKLAGDPGALGAALDTVEDPLARDLLVVRLVVDDPGRAEALCRLVTSEAATQRCQQILGRPHLRGGP